MKTQVTAAITAAALIAGGTGFYYLGGGHAHYEAKQAERQEQAAARHAEANMADGTATFQHVTAEKAEELTYTAQPWAAATVKVEYNDGVVAGAA